MYERTIEELLQWRKELSSIIRKAENRLRKAPEGQVRVAQHRDGFQFYLRIDPSDRNGKYIPAKERKLAYALIQKKYDDQIVKTAGKQVKVIDRFLRGFDPEALKEVYSLLPKVRQENVIPAMLPDQEFLEEWKTASYPKKIIDENIPEHYTSIGERVRSKSEVMIADALKQAGIPYRYECLMTLGTWNIHPDFTILRIRDRKQIYWEHLGKMDDPDYCNRALYRIRRYEENGIYPGIDLILTMETSDTPINLSVINSMIKTYCI